MTIIAFDIETIPDIEGGRRLYGLQGLGDKDVANVMFHKRRQEAADTEVLRHHLQRIVCISLAIRDEQGFQLRSLDDSESSEQPMIREFFDQIERHTPTLVSWNGSEISLPVLHYRSLVHGVSAPRYWETGEQDSSFRENNYLNRQHQRHTDLMDVLAGYQPGAKAPLNEMAGLLGFPGNQGMNADEVWDCFLAGDIPSIRNASETDVLNTYLIYLRYQLVRGRISAEQYQQECQLVRDTLKQQDKSHLDDFLAAWPQSF